MPCGTRADLAAHCNVNKSTVTRWDQAGKLVWTDDGLIDFEKSLELIGQSADPAKHGVRLRHQRERDTKSLESAMNDSSPATVGPRVSAERTAGNEKAPAETASSSDYNDFNKARALKEAELAKLAKIKREEQEGLLIRRDDVRKDIETLAVIVSKGLTGIPARVMPLINGEADPGKREALLEEQIRNVLAEFADAAVKLQE